MEGDLVSKRLNPANAAPEDGPAIHALEVVTAQLAVDGAVLEHVVDHDQDGMGNGDDGPLGSPSGRHPMVEG